LGKVGEDDSVMVGRFLFTGYKLWPANPQTVNSRLPFYQSFYFYAGISTKKAPDGKCLGLGSE
jgi:hypothetical protein